MRTYHISQYMPPVRAQTVVEGVCTHFGTIQKTVRVFGQTADSPKTRNHAGQCSQVPGAHTGGSGCVLIGRARATRCSQEGVGTGQSSLAVRIIF